MKKACQQVAGPSDKSRICVPKLTECHREVLIGHRQSSWHMGHRKIYAGSSLGLQVPGKRKTTTEFKSYMGLS